MIVPADTPMKEMSTFSLLALIEDAQAELERRKNERNEALILDLLNAIQACKDAHLNISFETDEYQIPLDIILSVCNDNTGVIYK